MFLKKGTDPGGRKSQKSCGLHSENLSSEAKGFIENLDEKGGGWGGGGFADMEWSITRDKVTF